MAAGIDAYRPAHPFELFIEGDWVHTDARFDAVDPSTGQVWASIPEADASQVAAAVAAARRALPAWRSQSPDQRQAILWQIAERMQSPTIDIPLLLATENGRPIREAAIADIPASAAIYRFFAGAIRSHRGATIPVSDAKSLIYTQREPVGVVAAVLSWNSPLITLANKIAPALAVGCTVVVKPSEYASASVLAFARMIQDLLPPGVLNVVTGTQAGQVLVSHPDVDMITFTGGPTTARAILASAANTITPALMELGGKSGLIVAEDADVDLAVQDALLGIFLANGEACIAASRLLVHRNIYDEFRSCFAETAARIRIGDAKDPTTELGPMVSARQLAMVSAHLDRAREDGVGFVTGDAPLNLPEHLQGGYYLRPTLLEDHSGSARIAREEVFGPVTVMEPFTEYDDAIARVNATDYGLAAGVWTRDLERAHSIAGRLQAGIVWVNKWFDLPAGMPMGGVGNSGFGRELCAETLDHYSTIKAIDVDLGAPRPPLWGLAPEGSST
jgi:acyl-CoA reductase-like NAD-dependent aldehyde dehydrogenase